MPRVHTVERARKDDPANGIKVGDKYYWWKFKNRHGNGTVVKSKTYPKGSQLTRSAFASTLRGIEERLNELPLDDSLHGSIQELASELRDLADETQGSLDNMPEGLQQGSTGELLQERIQAANDWADALEALDEPVKEDADPETLEREEGESDEDFADREAQAEQDAEEQAESDYDDALGNLKQEAEDSNPGEPG